MNIIICIFCFLWLNSDYLWVWLSPNEATSLDMYRQKTWLPWQQAPWTTYDPFQKKIYASFLKHKTKQKICFLLLGKKKQNKKNQPKTKKQSPCFLTLTENNISNQCQLLYLTNYFIVELEMEPHHCVNFIISQLGSYKVKTCFWHLQSEDPAEGAHMLFFKCQYLKLWYNFTLNVLIIELLTCLDSGDTYLLKYKYCNVILSFYSLNLMKCQYFLTDGYVSK